MQKKLIMGATLALSLAVAGTAQAHTNVQSLAGDWKASNSTVVKTPDGVHFGTYADGRAIGGSLMYKGANGLKLSQVDDYSFTFNYKQAGNLSGATPYARIFLDTDHDGATDTDVVLDPSLGGLVTPVQGVDQTFGTDDDSVRYGDDAGARAQARWADVKAAHGGEEITNVLVTQGYSMGTDVSAMVKSITFNGQQFNFNVAPADGAAGPQGSKGDTGTAGADGLNGKNGTNGTNGTTAAAAGVSGAKVKMGATKRTLHVASTKGMKLVGVRASLRGKSLPVQGHSIKVDLRGKVVGNYNVSIVAKYKTKGGKVHTVRSTRSLSVTVR
jgi:hypothetical protein